MKSSNIGGQAVMEGVMMMNKDRYSVAVRRPDGEIEVKVEQHKPLTKHKGLLKVPILRGVFSFADSMIVGMSSLMYSASFYEDEEEEKKKPATKEEEEQRKAKKEKTDRLMMYGTVTFSVVIAVVLFLMVPYFLSELLHKAGAGTTLDRGGRGLCACGTVPRLSGSHFPYGRHSARVYVPRRRA